MTLSHIGFQTLASRYAHLSSPDGKPIRVTFSGTTAYTRPQHLNLPAFEAGTTLTPYQYQIYSGYLDHETDHQRYTDFSILDDVKGKPQLMAVLNALEDPRIEASGIASFPGQRKYLDLLAHHCDALTADALRLDGTGVTPFWLIYKEAYILLRGLDTDKIAGRLADDPALAPILDLMQRKLPHCKTTRAVLHLAEELLPLIIPQPQSQPKPEPQPQGGGNSGNDETQSERNGRDNQNNPGSGANPQGSEAEEDLSPTSPDKRGDPEGEGEESREKDETRGTKHGRAAPSQSKTPGHTLGNGTYGKNGEGSGEQEIATLPSLDQLAESFLQLAERSNLLQNLLGNIKASNQNSPPPPDLTSNKLSLPPDTSADRIFVPSSEDLPQYLSTRAAVSAEVQALTKMLRIYLTSRSRRAWSRGLEEGTIDGERLAVLAACRETKVFKERRTRLMVDTAIELMIDLSSSMNSFLVRSAAICLAEALTTIPKLKLSICGFTTNNGSISHRQSRGMGRCEGMDILIFKDYDESYHAARGKLGAINTGGYTPLGCAYGKALERILDRKEPRRIVWLVTDGQPCISVGDNRHSDFVLMNNVHARAGRLGIETLALGIGEKSAEPYVDHFLYIDSIAELPQTLMEILKELHP